MAQHTFPTIDPAETTGAELATYLNAWSAAVLSQHSGSSRPAAVVAGTIWLDTSGAPIWTLKVYDGAADISLFAVDTTGNTARPSLGAQQLPTVSTFTGDAAETSFVLSAVPVGADALIVTIDGIVQQKTVAWSLGGGAGKTVTFTAAPPDGSAIVVTDLSDTAVLDPAQVAAVAGLADDLATVAGDTAAINAVATDIGGDDDIGTVAADIAAITTAASNIAAITAAPTAATDAQAAQTAAEAAQTAAESAKNDAETAQGAAETAQGLAEGARDDAETAQTAAEAAQAGATAAAQVAIANAVAKAAFRTRFGKMPPFVAGFIDSDVSVLTLTRATVATRIAEGGAPETVAIDGFRLEHNQETGESLGLLVEPAATNLVPSSDDLSSGWVVAPNLTRTTGMTDPSGGTKAVRLTCTASGAGDGTNYFRVFPSKGAATSACSEWWVRRVTGTGQVRLQNTSGVANGLDITSLIDDKWRKFQQAGGVGAGNIFCGVGVTVSGDEIDVAFPQIFADTDVASSYIPTTGTAATRSADLATVDLSAIPAFRPDGFSLLVEAEIRDDDGVLLSVGTGSTNEIALDMQSGDLHLTGADSLDLTAASGLSPGDRVVVALRVATDDVAVSVDGATVVTDSSHTMNADADEMQFGANIDGSDGLPCVIGQVAIFGPLPDATLEAMSNG
ncbi:MAG: hypothetical protein P1U37_18775 [Minwuia sp.]|nr:hypothetical protein [Minwuia sp.]